MKHDPEERPGEQGLGIAGAAVRALARVRITLFLDIKSVRKNAQTSGEVRISGTFSLFSFSSPLSSLIRSPSKIQGFFYPIVMKEDVYFSPPWFKQAFDSILPLSIVLVPCEFLQLPLGAIILRMCRSGGINLDINLVINPLKSYYPIVSFWRHPSAIISVPFCIFKVLFIFYFF